MGGDYSKISTSIKEVSSLSITSPKNKPAPLTKLNTVDNTTPTGRNPKPQLQTESTFSNNIKSPKLNPAVPSSDRSQTKANRKKEKIVLIAKNKQPSQEKKVLELIQKHNKEKKDYDMIYNIIDKHFFMQTLGQQARDEIITTMSLCKIKANATLFKEGSIGNYWYIIHEGTFALYIEDQFKKNLTRGDSFGEFALMNEAPRSATIKAVTDCYVWVLKREAFKKIIDFLSQLTHDENLEFLNKVDYLKIDEHFKSLISYNLIKQHHKKGEIILKQKELGTSLFIVKEGEVNCVNSKEKKIIRVLKQGEIFGQKAILTDNKRTLDVVARTDCVLYSLSEEFFRHHLGEHYKDVLYANFIETAFLNSKNFNTIYPKLLVKVFSSFQVISYEKNDVIFKKGENISNKLIICLEGNIYNSAINKIEAKRYEILFEDSLVENKSIILQHSLVAEPDCLLAVIDYDYFRKELGGDLENINQKSKQMHSLDNIALFKNLSEDKLSVIQSKLKIEKFDNGKKIIVQGETGDKFYIIKSGRVDFLVNSKYVRSSGENEEFGARSLIISEKRSATAIANGKVEVYTLTSNVFKSILEPNLLEYFQKKFYLEDNTIELKDLESIKELGKGNFGFVNLVRYKKNKQLYAIKALNVRQIKKEKLEKNVELEKNVLLKVDHPFIMKMVKYLKNDTYIFFVMEYIRGKELWEVIREIGLLNKQQTQFYGASMLLAIDYLHKKKVVYRDIKPENIMVNDKGYIKIIDFGTVKEIKEKTSTIIGTPHYMAPEMVKGEGYSFQVDVWSIAVCLFEFFCGKLPFGEDYDDPLEVYRAVAKEELSFPPYVHDEKFINLMLKMLKKSPLNRLWKLQNIKVDPYFKEFNWNQLISLSLEPPYNLKFPKEDLGTKTIPYVNLLKAITRDDEKYKANNRRPSARGIEFDKWFKGF
jgi:cGMP-dependent protein kinase